MFLPTYVALSKSDKFELIEIGSNLAFKLLVNKEIKEVEKEITNLSSAGITPVEFVNLFNQKSLRLQFLNDLLALITEIQTDLLPRAHNEILSKLPI
jgi:hypothetical protein